MQLLERNTTGDNPPRDRREPVAVFERAGVPTVTRMRDGRLIAAHQHFPENNDADFDKVAVRFSSDEGRTWSRPNVIQLTGWPEGRRFPFDPTLLALPDGRVRLYFTELPRGRRMDQSTPHIGSAISSNGVHYTVEPGVRFALEGRPVIDCAVVLHRGEFHLFAPDNGVGGPPPERRNETRPPRQRPRSGTGYHAISADGLTFRRVDNVRVADGFRWLGNASSDDGTITFHGTGDRGLWRASSPDGAMWSAPEILTGVRGADPGAVLLTNGTWLIVATGPPRSGVAGDSSLRRPRPVPQSERR